MKIHLTAQVSAHMERLAKNQLPFVRSLAINLTAVDARDDVRQDLPSRFTLRNTWTRLGIQVRPGNKDNPTAVIRAPGYMGIQETGGTLKPAGGFKMLSAPVEAGGKSNLIPKAQRPTGIGRKGFFVDMGGGEAGLFVRTGRKRKQIRLMWWLSKEQKFEERFEFEDQVREAVESRFAPNFARAFSQAMKTKRG